MYKKIVAASLVLFSSVSFAGYMNQLRDNKDESSYSDYGRVISVKEKYRDVVKPVEVCRKEIIKEELPNTTQNQSQDSVGGVIIGGIAGGILGNQVGKGSGKDLATAAGAITGAIVGNNIAKRGNVQPQEPARIVEREVLMCNTENRSENVLIGYDVEYTYQNKTFYTFMKNKPNSRVKLHIIVHAEE